MEDVHPDRARFHDPHDGVHIGPVAVDEPAPLVDDPGDLPDVLLEQPQGVGIGDHDPCGRFVHQRGHGPGGDDSPLVGRDRHGGVSAQGGAGRVRPVGRVGDEDLRPLFPPAPMPGMEDQHPRQLPLGARRRLQRHRSEARDLGEVPLQLVHQAERPLGEGSRQERVGRGESLEPCLPFVSLGIVLHRTGAERIKARIHPVIPGGETCVVADHLALAEIGEIGSVPRKRRRQWAFRHIMRRQRKAASPLFPALPEERFVQDETGGPRLLAHDPTSLARASIASRPAVSVTHNRLWPASSG